MKLSSLPSHIGAPADSPSTFGEPLPPSTGRLLCLSTARNNGLFPRFFFLRSHLRMGLFHCQHLPGLRPLSSLALVYCFLARETWWLCGLNWNVPLARAPLREGRHHCCCSPCSSFLARPGAVGIGRPSNGAFPTVGIFLACSSADQSPPLLSDPDSQAREETAFGISR